MKNKIVFSCFILLLLASALPLLADAPGLVNYQGRLRESGAPATGIKTMVFRLYDDPTGGTEVWTSDSVNVDVDRGVFSYKMGSHDPDSSGRYISNLAWSSSSATYWLELTVDGKTLLPRERFTTVPFAFQATNSDTIDGYHAATFASTTTVQAIALSTGTIQAQVNSLAFSTGTLLNQVSSIAFSTGSLQNQFTSVALSTASLQNQLNSVAGSTTSVQGQIIALAVSTGSIQSQVNNIAYSTGTISAAFTNYQLNLSTPVWQSFDSARLGSQLPSFYSQINATQTFTAQKTFLNQVTISSNAVVTGNAGIGTAAPADKLHVADGNVRIQGGTPILYLQNTDSPAGTASILNWQKNLIFKNGDGDERLQIREDNNVVINPGDGNVGIGTTSPSQKLDVAGSIAASNGRVFDKSGYTSMPGEIRMYAGSPAPSGWLMCDGKTIGDSSSGADYTGDQYKDLYDVIQNTYDTSLTYNWSAHNIVRLPDLRGIFPRGAGTNASSRNDFANDHPTYTGTLGNYSRDYFQGHRHQLDPETVFNNDGYPHTFGAGTPGWAVQAATGEKYANTISGNGTHGTTRTGSETAPASLGVNYIIKY